MSVRFENKAVVIDGVPTFIYSGEFEYFRVPPEAWEDRLKKLKAGGLNCVGLYFAWNYHSPATGQYNFTSAGCDLDRLLSIIGGLGLYAIARPGPYICNEWDLGGYPSWLLTVDSGDWRTADPKHLKYLREWYSAVNTILAKHQHDNGGPIILYQLENEYRWDDKALLDTLYDYTREDGIAVPLIGNHDGGAVSSGAKVTDGVDTYTGVGERYRWRGWNQAMYHRVGPDAPHMVLEFRGCDMSLWGEPEPSEERLPSEWIVGQEKLFTAIGANLTNRFIAAGGLTPKDFHSDHITTEYGTRAAVSPWGDVTATTSYALMRQWGEFLASVNRQMATSKPWSIGWGTDNPQVECLARRGSEGVFLTVQNVSHQAQIARIILPDPHPISDHKVQIGPGEIKVLVADLKLDRFTIAYSTAEILKIAELTGKLYVVLAGDSGTQADIAFDQSGRLIDVNINLAAEPVVRTAQVGDTEVCVYGISTEMALRTWFLETPQGTVPLFGGIDLAIPGDKAGTFVIQTPADGQQTVVTPSEVAKLDIAGVETVAASRGERLTTWQIRLQDISAPILRVGPIQARTEANWTQTLPSDQWRHANAYGPEREIILRPGRFRWLTQFELHDPEVDTLELLGVSGVEVEVFLNGKFVGLFPKVRPAGYPFLLEFGASFDIAGALRQGKNTLAIAMNLVGRHNCGQPIYAGLNAPVVLRKKEREEVVLPMWSASPFDNRRWLSGELSGRPAQAQGGYDRSAWRTIDLSEKDTHLWLRQGDVRHRARWYHTTIQVPNAFKGQPLFLVTSLVEEAWVYVDGECVARKLSGISSVYDLSRYSEQASFELTIAVRHNWYFFTSTWGLNEAPRLMTASRVIDPNWMFCEGTEGECHGWPVADEGWKSPEIAAGARNTWVRRTVDIEAPTRDLFAPIYVEMKGWSNNAEIYWNGSPIGLYACVGPQTKFYVPEGLISEHNQLAVHVSGYGQPIVIGNLDVKRYCVRRRLSISVEVDETSSPNLR